MLAGQQLLSGQHFAYRGGHGTLKVLSEIRAIPVSLHRLAGAIDRLCESQREAAPIEGRVEELERSRAGWEARMEAELLKADSTYKSASNAESRARTMKRSYEHLIDPLADEGEELEASVPSGNAEGSPQEWLPPMRPDVAQDPKANAVRSKFML